MNPRVLFIDDDPRSFAAYQQTLGAICQPEVAGRGRSALEAITTNGPFAAIVTSVGQSDCSGISLLTEMRQRAPDTVRIALADADDYRAAMAAVNVAQVFRFVIKPYGPEVMTKTVADAVAEYQTRRRRDGRSDSIFQGLVAAFAKLLTVAEPGTFGFGERLRERARDVGNSLRLESCADLEAAATLLRVGLTALPVSLLARYHERKPLTNSEADQLRRVPELGAQLLDNVPPLAGVAAIVHYQNKGFDGSGSPVDGVMHTSLPIGARILRPLVDLLTLEDTGVPLAIACQKLERDARRYDPEVLFAIARLAPVWAAGPRKCREAAMVGDLQPGMELECDVILSTGVRLMSAGTALSEDLIDRLRNFADLGQMQEPLFVIRSLDAVAA